MTSTRPGPRLVAPWSPLQPAVSPTGDSRRAYLALKQPSSKFPHRSSVADGHAARRPVSRSSLEMKPGCSGEGCGVPEMLAPDMIATLELPADELAPARARRFVAEALADARYAEICDV